ARWLDGDFRYRRDSSLGGGVRERRNADLRQLGARATLEGRRGPGGWRVALSAEEVDRGIPGKSFAPSDSARQRESGLTATARWTHRLQDLSTTLQLHHRLRRARFRDPAPPLGPPFDHLTDLTETGVLWRTEASPAGRTDVLARPAVGLEASVDRRRLRSDVLEDSGARTTLDAAVATYGSAALPRLPATPVVGAAVRGHRDGLSDSWLGAHEVSLELSLGPGRIRAAHRSSFSPPTAGDLFFRQGVGIRANPHLRPERVRSETELGGGLRLGRGAVRAEFSGELFTGDLDDMIVWAPDFRFVWSPRNVDVRRRGAEVRGELRHDGWGLSLGGHAARVHTTYRSGGGTPGSQVIYRPRDTGGATIALTASRWTAELRARYTGARHPVPAPVNVLEPFWAFDLSFTGQVELAGWQLQPGLHVERLLDQRSPFIHAFPEPGRTLSLELRARSRP
ncbi:MAG: hypothetical protein ACOCUZ_02645, partial [bacterium]